MRNFIFVVRENTDKWLDYKLYVKANEKQMEEREWAGGFLRFISEIYDYANNYSSESMINGQKVLSLREFDEWRKEHYCV